MKFKIVKPSISKNEFLRIISEQFPEIKAEIEDEDYKYLIHLQVAVFTRYANEQLKRGKHYDVDRVFNFFEKVIDKVDSSTENALYVSFLERVELEQLNENEIRSLLKESNYEVWKQLRNP